MTAGFADSGWGGGGDSHFSSIFSRADSLHSVACHHDLSVGSLQPGT